jgi:signal transduction histidine kinase
VTLHQGEQAWPVSRRALRASGYLLMQAAVILACILSLQLPLPTPDKRYELSEAMLVDNGALISVKLPYHQPPEQRGQAEQLFALQFDRPSAARDEAWSVLIPRFIRAVEVAVNGATILDSRRYPVSNRPDANVPQIVEIPSALLRNGANALTVRLHVWGPLTGFLDNVYVGSDEALRPAYQVRALLFLALPVVFASWQAILAVLLGVMWLKRRHEPTYGILAAAMGLGVIRAFASAPVEQSSYPALNGALLASAPLEAACVLIFMIAFLGYKVPRYAWIAFAPGLLIAAVAVAKTSLLGGAYVALGPATVLLSLLLTAILVGHTSIFRGDGIAALLGAAVTIIIVFVVHDMLLALDMVANRPILVSRLSYSALLVAIGIGLTWRFAKALNEVDSFAGRMVVMVREAEDKLRASLALEEQRARAAALADERNRLMRDLHDGLGGQLVSIVALSERSGGQGDRIGNAARGALKDLRLVIDAMDDIDGDLMLALGTWRERTAAQVRSHGLPLEWRVLTPQGMPVHPELRPWHVIQILRLLDEAVTNAVKHAGASRITVSIETVGEGSDQRGRITVQDDGRGFAAGDLLPAGAGAAKTGRGLVNMRRRAARCGADLDIESGPAGTSIRLDLPRRFPSVEQAAG